MAPESGPSSRLFLLKGSKNGNEIVLFVNALRVEHTITGQLSTMWRCPLEMSWAREVVAWIMRKEPLQRCEILATVEEMVFWKRILPALVEKARTDWTHRPDCKCVRTSRIPLCDNGNGEKIICSCGLGQPLDGTRFKADLKACRPTHLSKNFYGSPFQRSSLWTARCSCEMGSLVALDGCVQHFHEFRRHHICNRRSQLSPNPPL
jgi:hypothetical protein